MKKMKVTSLRICCKEPLLYINCYKAYREFIGVGCGGGGGVGSRNILDKFIPLYGYRETYGR